MTIGTYIRIKKVERGGQMAAGEEILRIFPDYMRQLWREVAGRTSQLQEIRLRSGREVIIVMNGDERYLSSKGQVISDIRSAVRVTEQDMEAILNHICDYSVYAFCDEIRQGFLTIPGGHRVGMAGQVILEENGTIRNMKHIRYMNIRISHEIKGAADLVMPYLYENRQLLNTLLISPPGCGKTTLLRDMIRQIADGNRYSRGMNVAVVDERSEIAGCYMGCPQNDLGVRTDVLDACPKVAGMMMLLRSMAPQVVAVDELGSEEDIRAVSQVMQCGSRMLATVHGESLQEIREKEFLKDLVRRQVFGRYVMLERRDGTCRVKSIYDRGFRICYGS